MVSFKEKVYKVVGKIPKGKVLTYAQIAKMAGSPRAFRAAGNALNKNKNPLVPCHRVIRSDGTLGGYRSGIKEKMRLLKKEDAI